MILAFYAIYLLVALPLVRLRGERLAITATVLAIVMP